MAREGPGGSDASRSLRPSTGAFSSDAFGGSADRLDKLTMPDVAVANGPPGAEELLLLALSEPYPRAAYWFVCGLLSPNRFRLVQQLRELSRALATGRSRPHGQHARRRVWMRLSSSWSSHGYTGTTTVMVQARAGVARVRSVASGGTRGS